MSATLSPWYQRAETDGRTTTHYVKIGTGNCYLTRGVGQTLDEIRANARLISSAPDLLAACQAALTELEKQEATHSETGWQLSANCCREAANALREAIMKATQ